MAQFFLEAFQWHDVKRGDAFAFCCSCALAVASAITGAQYIVDGACTAIGGAVTQAMQS